MNLLFLNKDTNLGNYFGSTLEKKHTKKIEWKS
jgi:hypothetical protein